VAYYFWATLYNDTTLQSSRTPSHHYWNAADARGSRNRRFSDIPINSNQSQTTIMLSDLTSNVVTVQYVWQRRI